MTVFYIPDVRILFSKKTEDILKTCQAHGLDYKIHQCNVAVRLLLHTNCTHKSVLCYVICYIYLFTTLLRNDGRSGRTGMVMAAVFLDGDKRCVSTTCGRKQLFHFLIKPIIQSYSCGDNTRHTQSKYAYTYT